MECQHDYCINAYILGVISFALFVYHFIINRTVDCNYVNDSCIMFPLSYCIVQTTCVIEKVELDFDKAFHDCIVLHMSYVV